MLTLSDAGEASVLHPRATHESDTALLERLAATLRQAVAPLLAGARRVALLDYPAYANVGDSAIWLGALALLRDLGVRPYWMAERDPAHLPGLARRLGPSDVVLITGGGNFGDIWTQHQTFREAVLAAFRRQRVVQLPQSLHFESPAALDRARRAVAAHPRFTLLVRDRASEAKAAKWFDAPVRLAPDCAVYLGPQQRPAPSRPIVWLARDDEERDCGIGSLPPGRVTRVDWPDDARDPLVRLQRWLLIRAAYRPNALRWLHRATQQLTFGPIARRRLRRGLAILGAGQVVVTDRLHGHLLALLLGIPHVILPSRTGKTMALHSTWTTSSRLAHVARTEREAVELAEELARG